MATPADPYTFLPEVPAFLSLPLSSVIRSPLSRVGVGSAPATMSGASASSSGKKKVVVTGLGTLTPLGHDAGAFFDVALGDSPADAEPGTGDDGNLIVESTHDVESSVESCSARRPNERGRACL